MTTVNSRICAPLRRQVEAVSKHFRVIGESPFMTDEEVEGGLAGLEFLVHELAHAKVLGLKLSGRGRTVNLINAVSRELKELDFETQAFHEAASWVVVFELFVMLGVCHKLGGWGVCIDEGCVQDGVTSELMEGIKLRDIYSCRRHALSLLTEFFNGAPWLRRRPEDEVILEHLGRFKHQLRFDDEWVRTSQLGGSRHSHHSAALGRLATAGLVEKRWREHPGPWLYRITKLGVAALQSWQWRDDLVDGAA